MEEPLGPKYRPNRPAEIDPIKGKNTKIKYIYKLSNNGLEPPTSSL